MNAARLTFNFWNSLDWKTLKIHGRVLLSLLAFKILYCIGLFYSIHDFATNDGLYSLAWPIKPTLGLCAHLVPYDGAFYLCLSEQGYVTGTRACAFYPLWPLVLRASALFGSHSIVAGFLLANLLSLLAWWILYVLIWERWGATVSRYSIFFFILYPGSLFYQFLYSESLFLFLLVMLLWFLSRQQYKFAFMMAFLLPLCRPVGVLCFLPLATYSVTARTRASEAPTIFASGSKPQPGVGFRLPHPKCLSTAVRISPADTHIWAIAAAPLLGWGLYLVLMKFWTGNPFEGFLAQRFWGVQAISNLWDAPKFVYALLTPNAWHAYRRSLLDRGCFVMLICCLPQICRLDKNFVIWALVLGVVPAMSATFTSFCRYCSIVFPMFVALGAHFSEAKRRPAGIMLLIAFAVIHVALVWQYVNFQWAG